MKQDIVKIFEPVKTAVIISSRAEWRETVSIIEPAVIQKSPYGEFFHFDGAGKYSEKLIFFHGGVGKISAAGSAQFVIDKFSPSLLINLGACGGFEGCVRKGDIIMADETVVYDIYDSMEGAETTLKRYITKIETGPWKELFGDGVIQHKLVSADRDLVPSEIETLRERFGAVAGDWESGAIAYVASKNFTKILILKGVSDIVSRHGGEAYGDIEKFYDGTSIVMAKLFKLLFKVLDLPSDSV